MMLVLDSRELCGVRGDWCGSSRQGETKHVHVWFNAKQVSEIAKRLGDYDANATG
jgi:hypothetical protein